MTEFEDRPADWLSYDEALERILRSASSLPVEEIPLSSALGRVLARPVISPLTLPRHDNSAMDGYAVRGEDVEGSSEAAPTPLTVVGISRPGSGWTGRVARGQAVRIMTGGPVPTGADGVVRVEDTDRERETGRVMILDDRDRGRHVRPRGEDVEKGEQVLPAGTPVGSGTVALLAALGIPRIEVRRTPRIAVLTTGDELIDATESERVWSGDALADSNGPALVAGLRGAGCEPLSLGIARDDEGALKQAILAGMEADALITVGGASMGEGDLVKRVLDRMGFRLDFWRIRARPGTPFGFGMLPRPGEKPLPVFGLPGNPVSAFVTFQVLVRPFALLLGGHSRIGRPVVYARAGTRLSSPSRFRQFLRVQLEREEDGVWVTKRTGPQGSGLVSSLGRADGLAVIREGEEAVEQGEAVEVILLGEGPGWHGDPGPHR